MTDLNIVFAGTPAFAAGHLQALIDAGLKPSAVYSQPDRKKGRGKKLQPTPVKEAALEHAIPVYQPLNFKEQEAIDELAALKPDVMIVVAYGLLLPKSVLDIPARGCINVHGSLLPRWRGAAPVERAIEAGDSETGITIMQMDVGLDTGAMLNIKSLPITAATTGDSLREELLELGCEALIETLKDLATGKLQPEKQDDSLATYAHKLTKEEAHIDWQKPAAELDRKIRAFTSSNVCYTDFGDKRIKVWQAKRLEDNQGRAPGEIIAISKKAIDVACREGALRLQSLQLPNGKCMDVAAVLNGHQGLFTAGSHFG